MRTLDLAKSVELAQGTYTTLNMLLEFVLAQDWSQDEATAACFERVCTAIKANPVNPSVENKDFDAICARLKPVNFPAQYVIELGYLRNDFVLKTPKTD